MILVTGFLIIWLAAAFAAVVVKGDAGQQAGSFSRRVQPLQDVAISYNSVSFDTDWGLLEGAPGNAVAQGVFALDELFSAAAAVVVYFVPWEKVFEYVKRTLWKIWDYICEVLTWIWGED
ncbi:uncharacterized protein A1O5_07635 [Cladophialophora psammophila CBS 110553]|uniref:Amino acid permease/ SLC12A domain-containing protein n=1 Tax=Cladophialophora psammophila CBS 110553 TaxID=1182543 RepID=W9XGW0_9EURO|nr:uncharacterized protein A1O5_07635 [Cladophialophora psammophila CBS 110553]EXJ69599.1 hypothetical protein A1O5_07635 [Cladophialophora psammophila CBS 110553]